MSSIEEIIVAALKADSRVRALIAPAGSSSPDDCRIYALLAPRGAALPLLVMQRISGVPETTMDGEEAGGLIMARIQITTWAADYPTTRRVARSVRKVLKQYPFPQPAAAACQVIQSCFNVGQGDILSASADDAGNREFGFRLDYQVWASES